MLRSLLMRCAQPQPGITEWERWLKNTNAHPLPPNLVDIRENSDLFDQLPNLGIGCCLDFLSNEEEDKLISEVVECFGEKPYEQGHWDNAIQKYREMQVEHVHLRPMMQTIFNRTLSLLPCDSKAQPVHIIDYLAGAKLLPHTDSSWAGDIVIGISLLSPSVMIFRHPQTAASVRVLMPPRSIYRITGEIREHWTHEINAVLDGDQFQEQKIPAGRRLAMLVRRFPDKETQQTYTPTPKVTQRKKVQLPSSLTRLANKDRNF
jgi:alkylated DNA repair protein alkB homolog 7